LKKKRITSQYANVLSYLTANKGAGLEMLGVFLFFFCGVKTVFRTILRKFL